ncbi:MAG: glucose PTS transporter subunit IIA [Psychrilyobacter sp.]|uniref:PTS sugar transporter subunit IIA n=1 Tax=Psychrilyobacter sp. TaxID=2586924 RepID=UPI003C769D67
MMSLKEMFKKNKEILVFSPLKGKVIGLSEVPDNVFTSNIIGDGCAIIPEPGEICAPISSKVEIFKTNHLLIFEPKKGVYIVVHFGVGTSLLEGKGFKRIVELSPKKMVEVGDKLISYDLDYLKENAKSIITPIIVSDDNVDHIELLVKTGEKVEAGAPLMKVTLK